MNDRPLGPFGIWLFPGLPHQRDRPRPAARASVAEVVAAIQAADDAGISEVWLGDEGPSGWDPFVVAATSLVATSRVRIGIGIANPVNRHASVLATAAITLDSLARGRVLLGLGTGGSLPLNPFGLRPARVADVEGALQLIRAVRQGMSTDEYRAPDEPIAAPSLPVYIGGRGPRLNTLASTLADGVMLSGVEDRYLDEIVRTSQSVRSIAVSVLPVSEPTESPSMLADRLRGLRQRFPSALVGASLVGPDPQADVDRFVQAISLLA